MDMASAAIAVLRSRRGVFLRQMRTRVDRGAAAGPGCPRHRYPELRYHLSPASSSMGAGRWPGPLFTSGRLHHGLIFLVLGALLRTTALIRFHAFFSRSIFSVALVSSSGSC